MNCFCAYREKKIVLYGLGQYTASLLSVAEGFHFIGLMDGDANNIGREIYGLKVIGIEEARKKADLIIINTSSFYWDLIYERIANIGVPVYFSNGERAIRKKQQKNLSDDERNISMERVKAAINCADIVSFDIYDTLLMRLVCSPSDVFKLIELRLEHINKRKIPFREMRNNAVGELEKENYTLEEVYDRMREIYPNEDTLSFQKIELEVESAVTVGRKDMIKIYQYAIEQHKDIYILSDMYLPLDFLLNILAQNGVDIDKGHLWISGEISASKNDKNMWKRYMENVVKEKKALHIGDSAKADIEYAKEAGIQTLKIASAADMLKEIVPIEIWANMNSLYASITTGIVVNELFNSPFSWNGMDEKFCIHTCRQFGRIVFGNVVLTYLLWLLEESHKRQISKLIFLSRDGYFLQQDYLKLVCKLHLKSAPEAEYMYISRKAVLTLAAKDEKAFSTLLGFSYIGNFRNYLKDRFDVDTMEDDEHAEREIQLPNDQDKIKDWIKPYLNKIYETINSHCKRYSDYINEFTWDSATAIVDICYTGTIQYWLAKILNMDLTGFYCVANVSDENPFKANNEMITCFQKEDDCLAETSALWKNHKIVESFFTAPYGMMKSMNRFGEFITYETSNNQKYFIQRELINEGCNEYIADYVQLLKKIKIPFEKIETDSIFVDVLFGNWFQNKIAYSSTIKKCFWHEDGFINSDKEVSLF